MREWAIVTVVVVALLLAAYAVGYLSAVESRPYREINPCPPGEALLRVGDYYACFTPIGPLPTDSPRARGWT